MAERIGRKARALALGFMLAGGLAGVLAGCGSGNGAEETEGRAPQPVRVATVAPAPEAGAILAAGTVELVAEMPLSFIAPGPIAAIHVDIGDRVTKGQRLAELDRTQIDARIAAARAQDRAAAADLARAAELKKQGFLSQARLDGARAARDAAAASLAEAEFSGTWQVLEAPADGVVLQRMAEPNQIVSPGQPVLLIGDRTQGMQMRVAVSDRDIVRIAAGDPVEASFPALGTTTLRGTVRRLSAKADARTGAFDVEVQFPQPPPALLSGMVGEARIQPSRGAAVALLAVPAEALLEAAGTEGAVFKLDPEAGAVRRTRVTLAGLRGEVALVSGGLAAGDTVISTGAAYLRDGDRVSVVTDAAADTPPAN